MLFCVIFLNLNYFFFQFTLHKNLFIIFSFFFLFFSCWCRVRQTRRSTGLTTAGNSLRLAYYSRKEQMKKKKEKKHKNVGNLRMMIHLTVHIRSFFISICGYAYVYELVYVYKCKCMCENDTLTAIVFSLFFDKRLFLLCCIAITIVLHCTNVCALSACVCKSHAVLFKHTSEVGYY